MAKRTIKQTEATAGVKKTTPAKKTTTRESNVAKPRAPRAARTPGFVPPTAEDIAVRAYFRAAERGFAPGNAMEDWLAAEAELVAWRKAATVDPTPVRKT